MGGIHQEPEENRVSKAEQDAEPIDDADVGKAERSSVTLPRYVGRAKWQNFIRGITEQFGEERMGCA